MQPLSYTRVLCLGLIVGASGAGHGGGKKALFFLPKDHHSRTIGEERKSHRKAHALNMARIRAAIEKRRQTALRVFAEKIACRQEERMGGDNQAPAGRQGRCPSTATKP